MRIEVIQVYDTTDGGLRMIVEMDEDTVINLAKVGLITALRNAAEQAVVEHGDLDDEG